MTIPVIEHMLAVYKVWYASRDNMPKKSRYTLGDKIDARFIQALELLYMASYQGATEKIVTLSKALALIDTLKFLFRIGWDLKAIDEQKYLALSKDLDEVGRQAGGWKRGLQTKTSAHAEETR